MKAEAIMDFLVIGTAKRVDVDFLLEPTLWLEAIGEATVAPPSSAAAVREVVASELGLGTITLTVP
jgi:hypothetical protein